MASFSVEGNSTSLQDSQAGDERTTLPWPPKRAIFGKDPKEAFSRNLRSGLPVRRIRRSGDRRLTPNRYLLMPDDRWIIREYIVTIALCKWTLSPQPMVSAPNGTQFFSLNVPIFYIHHTIISDFLTAIQSRVHLGQTCRLSGKNVPRALLISLIR